MRIEEFSIKTVTTGIFVMILVTATVLSLFAGHYFRQAALDEQMNSLSRVIEVATEEMLKEIREYTFNLGMRLGNSNDLIMSLKNRAQPDGNSLAILLDDPFINGFVGFANINLEKIRIFDLDLNLIAESSKGISGLDRQLAPQLTQQLNNRHGIERLQAVDTLWASPHGPLHSTITPIGGLNLIGYLEIIINPALNLPDIGKITKTPISVFSTSGKLISADNQEITADHLPVKYTLQTSDGEPAFRIVGYENVAKLNAALQRTQIITTTGFLLLTVTILLIALWLFNRFLLDPLDRMINSMKTMTDGHPNLKVDKTGVREFYTLAEAFNSMANQVQNRTDELRNSQDRLLHLLDLDDSVILCSGNDNEIVYFNKGASNFFGYSTNEMRELDLSDLFADDIAQLMMDSNQSSESVQSKLHTRLNCLAKAGNSFQSSAVINTLDSMTGIRPGYAIALNPSANTAGATAAPHSPNPIELNAQHMSAVEQSLNRILEITRDNPGLLRGLDGHASTLPPGSDTSDDKATLRKHAVGVMRSALACWEHDLGKSKLELADESRIWPVYIDKSTPTTRTLDKYLHMDNCPQNPRCQRVIDTADFVLKQMRKQVSPHQQELVKKLQALRHAMSGV
jgi:HAMP domain-containing protein